MYCTDHCTATNWCVQLTGVCNQLVGNLGLECCRGAMHSCCSVLMNGICLVCYVPMQLDVAGHIGLVFVRQAITTQCSLLCSLLHPAPSPQNEEHNSCQLCNGCHNSVFYMGLHESKPISWASVRILCNSYLCLNPALASPFKVHVPRLLPSLQKLRLLHAAVQPSVTKSAHTLLPAKAQETCTVLTHLILYAYPQHWHAHVALHPRVSRASKRPTQPSSLNTASMRSYAAAVAGSNPPTNWWPLNALWMADSNSARARPRADDCADGVWPDVLSSSRWTSSSTTLHRFV